MSVRFEIDYSELEQLQEKFKQIPDLVESVINDYLHNEGVDIAKNAIQELMPLSDRKKRPKQHAKNAKSLRHTNINLGFEIRPMPRFNYLVFPDRGLGTSYKSKPQEFMRHGLDKGTNKLLDQLNERIDEKIKEELS